MTSGSSLAAQDTSRERLQELMRLPVPVLTHLVQDKSRQLCHQAEGDDLPRLAMFFIALTSTSDSQRYHDAWATIYAEYSPLMRFWIDNHSSARRVVCDEGYTSIINNAFMKFEQSLNRESMKGFTRLSSLLMYLKRCVNSVVVDARRKLDAYETRNAMVDGRSSLNDSIMPTTPSLEQEFFGQWKREQLWMLLTPMFRSEIEQTVFYLNTLGQMYPEEICLKYAHLVQTPKEVCSIRQRILERVRRNPTVLRDLRAVIQ